MIGTLLTLWKGGSLTKYAIIAAIGAALFFTGLGIGNVRATRRFVEQVQDHDARQLADYTGRLAAQIKAKTADMQAHLNADAARGRSADDHATATLTAAVGSASHDRDMALSALAKERAKPKEITVNATAACPEIVPFSFGSDARGLLDRAAGAVAAPASPAGPRDPSTETARTAP